MSGPERPHDGLARALDLASGWVEERVVPGVAVAVARDGVIIAERYAGKRSAGGGGPVDATTLYSVAAVTKPVTATLALRLVERGDLVLDEPVRRILPAFSDAAKREITPRHLLCHTSGLPQDDPALETLRQSEVDLAAITASALALDPVSPPGERVRYSNAAYWVLGAALAAAGGASFAGLVQSEVLARFGLEESCFAPPAAAGERIARRYGAPKHLNTSYARALASPSGGLFATARDLVTFASLFLTGGSRPDATGVLSAASVTAMTTDQTGGLPGGIDGFRTWPVCPWGLGWEVKGEKRHHWSGDFTSAATLSHIGQSGALLWADPATGLACAILANRDLGSGWSFHPARWARLSNAICAVAVASAGTAATCRC